MVSLEEGRERVFDWIFCLFRSLHEQKFISSFSKLGLEKLPHAVACAKYHVLSNSLGGVSVEYMEESDKKAWVRFRYPRWLYSSAAICGIPIEVSRGFLHGWYAHNGISLNNPKLGFICVSEDMTGQFGLCGYFKEFDHNLSLEDRLQFSADEVVPDFNSHGQPSLPGEFWGCERLIKAKRNYAIDYYSNSLVALGEIIGFEKAEQYGMRVGRLIGAQYYRDLAIKINVIDGGPKEAVIFIEKMMSGLGDLSVAKTENQDYITSIFLVEYSSILKVIEYRHDLHAVNGQAARTFPSRLTFTSSIPYAKYFFILNNASALQANAPFVFDDNLNASDINVDYMIRATGFNTIRAGDYTDENGIAQDFVLPGDTRNDINTTEDIDYRCKGSLTHVGSGSSLKFYPMYYDNYTAVSYTHLTLPTNREV